MAIIGCGFIADAYVETLRRHPQVVIVGAFDRDPRRLAQFCRFWELPAYRSLAAVVADARVDIVVNLTSARSHYAVSRAALEAGKHVYTEKPLAMDMPSATALVELAEERDLLLSSAPCSLLGESAQTLWKALRDGAVGPARLVYAELDDGPVYRRAAAWHNESGAPWPLADELETGCAIEHAAYYLTWLTAFFGPARSITAFARTLVPDKGVAVESQAPDFSVACIEFESNVVARFTVGIVAPFDQSFVIVGEDGVLSVDDAWNYAAPVHFHPRTDLALRLQHHPLLARLLGAGTRPVTAVRTAGAGPRLLRRANVRDVARGVIDLAEAAADGRAPRLSARHALHVAELTLAMQDASGSGATHTVATRFDPIAPMPWAE